MKMLDFVKKGVVIGEYIRHYDLDLTANGNDTEVIHRQLMNNATVFYIDPEFALELKIGDEITIDPEETGDYLGQHPWITKIVDPLPKTCSFVITRRFIEKDSIILWADF